MNVLIVESNADLAALWAKPLETWGHSVTIAASQKDAAFHICESHVDVIVLDLNLSEGSAMAVADLASYRQPNAQILAITAQGYFSDGSIFAHLGNARAMVSKDTPPQDLGALVEYYAA